MQKLLNIPKPKECPFCGCTMMVQSNQIYHRLIGVHKDNCFFDENSPELVTHKSNLDLLDLVTDWNSRSMGLHAPTIISHGMWAEHNQCCAVYPGKSAVLDMTRNVFSPSWDAQFQGWRLVHAQNWFQLLILRLFFD